MSDEAFNLFMFGTVMFWTVVMIVRLSPTPPPAKKENPPSVSRGTDA